MPRFFVNTPCEQGRTVVIDGLEGKHIVKSLRMQVGEKLVLCDGRGMDYDCEVESLNADTATVRVLQAKRSTSEPSIKITLAQSLPKADKMDTVVQKAVELGVTRVIPMLSSRCISRPDPAACRKKTERWQKIATEAAKQCGRGIIPEVAQMMEFKESVKEAAKNGEIIFFYEGGGQGLTELIHPEISHLTILIGPEGGFSPEEVEIIKNANGKIATLGPRILRTETAPVAALAAVMVLSGNMEGKAFWEG